MTHELTIRENGMAEMAYAATGEEPWHGLGQSLPPGATRQQWIEAAGFDWEVKSATPHFFVGEAADVASVDDRRVLYRSDNNKYLSIVSDRFKIVQPAHIMDYFDDLARSAGFVLDTAGTLYGGRQFWALANIGDEAAVADPRDRVKGRLLLATSVDLTLPTIAKFIAERVVCRNTLSYGLGETGSTQVKIRHSSTFNPADLNAQLGITAHARFAEIMDDFRRMADRSIDEFTTIRATAELVNPDAHELSLDDLIKVVNSRSVQRICQLTIDGVDAIGGNLQGVKKSAWGWLNAVTQFVDHESKSATPDARLSRAWFGDGERMKSRALSLAESLTQGDDMFADKFKELGAERVFSEMLSA